MPVNSHFGAKWPSPKACEKCSRQSGKSRQETATFPPVTRVLNETATRPGGENGPMPEIAGAGCGARMGLNGSAL